jgi:hypothetical protein
MQLLRAKVSAETVQRGAALDRAAAVLASRFGLADERDGGGAP